MIINLTALAETRAKMTPGDYEATGDSGGVDPDCLIDSPSGVVAATFESARPEEDARGIVATHNAADVLIEVARAALALRDAHSTLETVEREMMHVGIVSVDQLLGVDTVRDAKVKVNEAGAALLAALAKVSL